MLFGAGRAVAFAGIFIAQAGKLVATADAIAVASFRRGLDGDECHRSESLRFRAVGCKWSPDVGPRAKAVRPTGSSDVPSETESRGAPADPPSAVPEWS